MSVFNIDIIVKTRTTATAMKASLQSSRVNGARSRPSCNSRKKSQRLAAGLVVFRVPFIYWLKTSFLFIQQASHDKNDDDRHQEISIILPCYYSDWYRHSCCIFNFSALVQLASRKAFVPAATLNDGGIYGLRLLRRVLGDFVVIKEVLKIR